MPGLPTQLGKELNAGTVCVIVTSQSVMSREAGVLTRGPPVYQNMDIGKCFTCFIWEPSAGSFAVVQLACLYIMGLMH